MSGLTHALGHLLLSLHLHIDISRTSLYSPDKLPLRNLHGLYLAALLGKILKRRLCRHHLRNTTCRHKRDIRCKKLIDLLGAELASVETDLRHLALFQSLIYLLQIPVLYSCTNHNLLH